MTTVENSRYFVSLHVAGQWVQREFCEFNALATFLYEVARRAYGITYYGEKPVLTFSKYKNGTVVTGNMPALLFRSSFYVEIQLRNGYYLSPEPFLEYGARAYRKARLTWRSSRYARYPGYGPVPGVSNGRHPRGAYFRRMRTIAERRMNDLVLTEEGEVAARPRRTGRNLPNSWDDITRSVDHCWKSQHKGRKAWMRGGR